MNFSKLIFNKLVAKKITVYRLAQLTDIPTSTLYRFLNGQMPIKSDALGRIFDALEIKIK